MPLPWSPTPTGHSTVPRTLRVVGLAGVLAVLGSLQSPLVAQVMVPKKEIEERLPPADLPFPEIAEPGFEDKVVTPWWWYAAGGAAGLVILAGLVWLATRPRKPRPVPPHAPLREAMQALEALRPRLAELTPSEVAHDVSLIIRTYLQGRYALPAPFRTTEEIYRSPALATREPLKERFQPVAAFYDRVEFAPQPRTQQDSERLVDAALSALREEQQLMSQPLAIPTPEALDTEEPTDLPPSATASELAPPESLPQDSPSPPPPVLIEPRRISLHKH